MAELRARLRKVRPEALVLAGCVLGFGGNCGTILWTILTTEPGAWAGPALAASIGIGASLVAGWVLARRPRNASTFGILGLLASAVALMNLAGVVAGTVALLGAMWGFLLTFEPR